MSLETRHVVSFIKKQPVLVVCVGLPKPPKSTWILLGVALLRVEDCPKTSS